MAVPLILSEVPDVAPYIQYVATSGQTVFPYPFPITQDSDLVVVYNGTTLNTDAGYSITGQGNDTGGNVTFTAGAASGDIVTFYRNIPIERVSQISQNSGFSSTVFNAEYNNIYLIMQQLEAAIAQCLQIPNTNSPAPATTLTPAAYANKYLAFDQYGNPTPALLTSSGSLTQAVLQALLWPSAASIAQGVGADIYPKSSAETSASVVVTDYTKIWGDVRRYGAVINSTVDDSTAIQYALDVSATHPTTSPGGTSIIGTTLTVPAGGRVVLDADTVWEAKSTLTGAILEINAVDDVQITGGLFFGNSAASNTYGVYVLSSTNVGLYRVNATGATQVGIEISGTSSIYCSGITVQNCRSYSNGASGFSWLYTNDSRMEGCTSDHNAGLGTIGGACNRLSWVGNTIHHNDNDGLAMGDSSSFIVMTGNTSSYNGSEGLNFDGCNHSVMVGNTSYQNLIGIAVWNRSPGDAAAGHNTVSGNTVYECYLGILLTDGQENVTCSNNVVRNNGAAFSGTPSGTGNVGIFASALSDFNISGNTVVENTGTGIFVSAAIGGAVSDNIIRANGEYGIDLEAGTGIARITLQGNQIKENGDGSTYKYGIYIASGATMRVLNNTLIEENNPGVQQVPIFADVDGTSICQGNVSYAPAAQACNIQAGAQRGNSWNYQTAAPTTGVWAVGDIVWNSDPSAGGAPGWVCTTAGTSGTWKAMGNLAS